MGLGNDLEYEKELSFVTKLDKKEAKRQGRSYNFWDTTPTDNWFADCETGKQYAGQFLRYICRDNNYIPLLTDCVLDMRRREDRSDIEIGFCEMICQYAMFSFLFREILNEWDPFKLIAFWKEHITGDEIDSYLEGMLDKENREKSQALLKKVKQQAGVKA
jgi:hypothetical protein